jgi:hypothetical protein
VQASALTDALRDLWGPGIVFLALCAWLIRRALRAARNESILEEQRLREALGQGGGVGSTASPTSIPTETPRSPARVPAQLFRADVRGASQEHLDLVARLLAEREATAGAKRADVLWVRSNPTHVAWAELRPGNREVICVAQVDAGTVVARWQFG